MQRLSDSGIVNHGGRSDVAECGPLESKIGGVMEMFMYMTQ